VASTQADGMPDKRLSADGVRRPAFCPLSGKSVVLDQTDRMSGMNGGQSAQKYILNYVARNFPI